MTQKYLWSCFAGNIQNAIGIFSTWHFYTYKKNKKVFTAVLSPGASVERPFKIPNLQTHHMVRCSHLNAQYTHIEA